MNEIDDKLHREALRSVRLDEYHAALERVLSISPEFQVSSVEWVRAEAWDGWSANATIWVGVVAGSPLGRSYLEHYLLKSLPESGITQGLRDAFNRGEDMDRALARAAVEFLEKDPRTADADALLVYIKNAELRYQTAVACVDVVIRCGLDKWAMKFALRLGNEIDRLDCGCKAIAYIVELDVEAFADSCESTLRQELRGQMASWDRFDACLISALHSRGGRPLVEKWAGWKRKKLEDLLLSLESGTD